MGDIKVSIIIPVYNPGDLLVNCLDSVSNQTLKDIEIICVDDGSSDGSLDILNQYAKNDSRFKVLTQLNKGAGIARNNGIEQSKGEYIVFLDSDDYIELDMCELLYNHAKKLHAELILFDNRWHFKDSFRDFIHFENFNEDYNKFVFNHKYAHNKVFSGFFSVIWTKFYKSSFIRENKIDFPPHKLYNDMEFHVKSMLLAERIGYYPKIFYHYNKSDHSSLQSVYVGKKEAIVFYDVICGMRDFIIEYDFMDEFRLDFLNFSFRHFYTKMDEIEKYYKNEFFLKFKKFFESLLITPNEFKQMSFRNLVIYNHMVNSKYYDEYKLRMDLFDMELINPNKYFGLINTYDCISDIELENNNHIEDFNNFDYINDVDVKERVLKSKLEANNFYTMLLEDKLSYKIKELSDEVDLLNHYIKNLKKTTDEYYRIKENYKLIQKQNIKLINENNELKNSFFNKIKNLF